MQAMAFQVIEKQVLYKGNKINLEVHHLQDDWASGTYSRRSGGASRGGGHPALRSYRTIVLIRNKRYTIQQILLELPAGTLEHGESPDELCWTGIAGGDGVSGSADETDWQFLQFPGSYD